MLSKKSSKFEDCFNRLPQKIQAQVERVYALWQENPRHPGLHFKQVHPTIPIYSVRIGLSYRALAVQKDDGSYLWFWIGAHPEYDRLLKQF